MKKIKEFPDFPFVYIHRENRKGFKAGALKEGLEKAKGEFIAIFDADFLPSPDFFAKDHPSFSKSKGRNGSNTVDAYQ